MLKRRDDIFERLEKFKEIVESPGDFDSSRAQVLFHELKIILMKNEYLSSDANKINFAERMMFREILELAIIMCVKIKNFKDIQNYFSQLSFFYFENNDLPQSERMFTIIDVSLLMDLAFENKDEYFEINLTQILKTFPTINFIIQFVLDVKLCLNDNSISKLTKLMKTSPSYLFDVFLNKILYRIRKTLAKNEVKQPNGISSSHLAKLLQFNEENEMGEFLDSLEWKISDSGEIICKPENVSFKTENCQAKLKNYLSYAFRFNSLL
ncbi:hypothetical protein M9Y10_029395 [Tritrichomonas musculus]|uniref:CSN8/PSMD8/EIF3K domain-containing protein n=1 Tax=Tritrichomonas musculus TaxID=1915356 RepID=A0ABR2KP20_9EUKA